MNASRPTLPAVRAGFSLPELLVVMGVVGLLLALLIPAVLYLRERGRAVTCKDHLRQLILAAQSHESSHHSFPYTSTKWVDSKHHRRYRSVSPFRDLMVSLDPTLFKKIDMMDETTPGWGELSPFHISPANAQLQSVRLPVLMCPSDDAPPGSTNYRANLGISAQLFSPQMSQFAEAIAQRGAFVNGRKVRAFEFRDGLANTAMFSERLVGDGNPHSYTAYRDIFSTGNMPHDTPSLDAACASSATADPKHEYSFSGYSWLLGGWLNTWYTHIHGPNSLIPDCSACGPGCTDGGDAIHAARSFHSGGVHVAMGDGTVRFVSDNIDISVWKAIGTRNGEESVSDF